MNKLNDNYQHYSCQDSNFNFNEKKLTSFTVLVVGLLYPNLLKYLIRTQCMLKAYQNHAQLDGSIHIKRIYYALFYNVMSSVLYAEGSSTIIVIATKYYYTGAKVSDFLFTMYYNSSIRTLLP